MCERGCDVGGVEGLRKKEENRELMDIDNNVVIAEGIEGEMVIEKILN